MAQFYQGMFKPKNPNKYKGDVNNIVYRSSWELAVLKWADANESIKSYSSEEIVIPYYYEIDKKTHRYFVDMFIEYTDGRKVLVEIKPKKQTGMPSPKGKNKQQYLSEAITYVKNQNKWKAAVDFCKERRWIFEIWTEEVLKAMGILKTMPGSGQQKKLKPLKPFKKPSKKSI